jgi:alpha/beta superfamily hydrolase
MQLLMRRPEIESFISVAPPANMLDFNFLAPCPASGQIIHGAADEIVPEPYVAKLVAKLSSQRGVKIDYHVVPGAGHFFADHLETLTERVEDYLDLALYQRPVALAMTA